MCNESLLCGLLNDTLSSADFVVLRARMIFKGKSKYTVILVHTTKASEAGGMTPRIPNLDSSCERSASRLGHKKVPFSPTEHEACAPQNQCGPTEKKKISRTCRESKRDSSVVQPVF
jgi:hypothetical protein